MTLDPDFCKTLDDWIRWYNYNRKDASGGGVENRLNFMEKAVHGLFLVNAAMADELARVSGVPKDAPKLILPLTAKF